MKKKNIIAGLLSLSMILIPVKGIYANTILLNEVSTHHHVVSETKETQTQDKNKGNDKVYGYIPMQDDFLTESDNTNGVVTDSAKMFMSANEQLLSAYSTPKTAHANVPSVYNTVESGYVTRVKDQGRYGTCWAFATIACAESNLIKKGLYNKENIDLSEFHLAYFAYHPVMDPLGGTANDTSFYKESSNGAYLNNGGNFYVSMAALANWMGVADEKIAPYTDQLRDTDIDSSKAYANDIAHLQNVEMVPMDNVTAVKQKIMEYGAGGISYFDTSTYYNEDKSTYYCPYVRSSNHAVTVVGWDDNYDASKFSRNPQENGAWLIKNSWGEDEGEMGYMWLSYYDKSIDTHASFFDFESADNYDYQYQYDGEISTHLKWYYDFNSAYSVKAANTFVANSNEALKAVSFYTMYDENVKYSIQVYKNLSKNGNPEDGKKVFDNEQSGVAVYTGYHTVELDKEVQLQKGERYSVIVTLEVDECSMSPSEKVVFMTEAGVNDSSSAKEYQSYVYESFRNKWYDVKDYSGLENNNIKIKAFTMKTDKMDDDINKGDTETGKEDDKKEDDKNKGDTETDKDDDKNKDDENDDGRYIAIKNILPKVSKVSSKNYKTNTIKWNKVAIADGYYIYRKQSGGKYKKIATINGFSKLSYSDKTAATGVKYYYAVRAFCEIDGKEYLSKLSSGKKVVTILPKVSKIKKVLSGKNATISWDKVNGATGYEIYKKSGGKYKKVSTISSSKRKYTVKGISKGKTYNYKIRVYRKVSGKKVYSKYSTVIKIKR